MPYQHILIAVDLTDECHPVVERALAIAASMECTLRASGVVSGAASLCPGQR